MLITTKIISFGAFIALLSTILVSMLTPCQFEDSHSCSWDAASHGNGVGTSFIDVFGVVFEVN